MTTLLDRHDLVLADLDGTLYQGRAAIPGAVDAVRAAADLGDDLLEPRTVGHVAGQRDRAASGGYHFACRFVGRVLLEVDDHDCSAIGRQSLDDGLADALRAAGNQGDLAA